MARIEPAGRGYRVRYYADGKHRSSETFPTLKAAKAFAQDVEVDKRRGNWRDPNAGKETLRIIWDAWVADVEDNIARCRVRGEEPRPGEKTLKKWQSVWRTHIAKPLGSKPIAKITRGDVKRVRDRIASPHQANEALKVIHLLLQRAVDDELIAENKAHRVEHRELPSRSEPRVLQPDQIDQLADAVGPDWRALVYLACYGGLRLSEAFAVRFEKIDWLHRRVKIDSAIVDVAGQSITKTIKTRAKGERWVDYPSFVIDELAVHCERKGITDGLLFRSRAGTAVGHGNFYTRVWSPALETLKLKGKFTAREMRHTGASLVIAADGTLKDVADRLGHTTTIMADRLYTKLYDERKRDLADRIGALRKVKSS
jgi:integrase